MSAPSGPSVMPNPPPVSSLASSCFVARLRLEVEFFHGDRQALLLLVLDDLDRHRRARLRAHDDSDERVAVRDGLAVELDDDVAGFHAGFRGRSVRGRASTTRAPRLLPTPSSSAASLGTFCTVTPMRPRTTLPFSSCGRISRMRVDRHREADADVGAAHAVGVDRRIDANHFAAHVQERTARVPGLIAASVWNTS